MEDSSAYQHNLQYNRTLRMTLSYLLSPETSGNPVSVLLVGVATLLSVSYLLRKRSDYPPGPPTLPVVGNLLQIILSGSMVKFCEKYRKIYGNVFSVKLGGRSRVVVSGYDCMHELLVKKADYTSGRSTNSFSETVRAECTRNPGLFWSPYPHWKTIRSFSLAMLRDGGMGKAAFEPQITEEIERYIQTFIEPHLGQPINLDVTLPLATSNVISQLLFGRRFEYDDATFNRLVDAITENIVISSRAVQAEAIPFRRFLRDDSPLKREKYLRQEVILPSIRDLIEENRKSLHADDPRCLIDQFILSSESEQCFTDGNCVYLGWQLLIAGTETTSTTLRWAFLFMCLYPEVMDRVQKEIDQIIGQRSVLYKDHLEMPYTNAVLLETQRVGNVVNTSLPHTVERDMYIDGEFIPGGADVLLNMASVLHDEEVFEEPMRFNPGRYLTGDITLKKQRTIPFGIGRRSCLGESLAKVELFLILVNLLQRYSVRLPQGSKVSEEPLADLLSAPAPYHILFTSRG